MHRYTFSKRCFSFRPKLITKCAVRPQTVGDTLGNVAFHDVQVQSFDGIQKLSSDTLRNLLRRNTRKQVFHVMIIAFKIKHVFIVDSIFVFTRRAHDRECPKHVRNVLCGKFRVIVLFCAVYVLSQQKCGKFVCLQPSLHAAVR